MVFYEFKNFLNIFKIVLGKVWAKRFILENEGIFEELNRCLLEVTPQCSYRNKKLLMV